MKKFLIAIVVIISVVINALPAIANDYVVIKNGEKITVNEITTNSNESRYWVTTYDLVNPTIKQLSEIGLPNYCWGWISGQDGAYDTRLTKAAQSLDEMKANYENEHENTLYLEEQAGWHTIRTILLTAVFLALLVVSGSQKIMINKLRLNQK